LVKFLDNIVVVACFIIFVLSISISHQDSEGALPFSQWAGNGDGISWSDPKNWDRFQPDGSNLNNIIHIESEVQLDIDLTLQNTLRIMPAGKLIIQEGITLTIEGGRLVTYEDGILENYGTIIVDGGLEYPNMKKSLYAPGPIYIPDKSRGKILFLGEIYDSGLIINHGKIYCTKNSVVNVECEPVIEKMEKNKTNQVNLIISPLKQKQSGVLAKNVDCKPDFVLMIKKSNGNAVCVKESTSHKLEEKDWGIAIIAKNIYPPINTPAKPTAGVDDVMITLKREGGVMLASSVYDVTIFGNGTVIFDGKDFVETKGTVKYQIETSDVQTLIDLFYEIDYFSLKDSYEIRRIHYPSTSTLITVDDVAKGVYNYGYAAPDTLNELEGKIDQIVNSEQYVGMQP